MRLFKFNDRKSQETLVVQKYPQELRWMEDRSWAKC